jgi:Domain of unknown function (DUF6134)
MRPRAQPSPAAATGSIIRSPKDRRSVSRRALLISGVIGLTGVGLPHRGPAKTAFVVRNESANRRFSVFYKGDKIGTHTVLATPETGEIRVNTEIVLEVKAFFFTMFAFSHRSEERWRNNRLAFLKSETVERGEKLFVEGASVPQGFRVVSKGGPFIASADALTSNSLWSPAILDQETVIDAQHGGIIGVSVRKLADEQIVVLGRQVATTRYRFITPYLAGSIWYDDAGRWVHGEFERDGAMIAYRLEA